MNDKMFERKALTLKEVASITGFSYWTIFNRKHELGAFRLSDLPRHEWRVWSDKLDQLTRPRNNVTCVTLRVIDKDTELCPSTANLDRLIGGSTSRSQAAKELDALLSSKTNGTRKRITTNCKPNSGKPNV